MTKQKHCRIRTLSLGSGCGSVGRAVASDARDPWFEIQSSPILFTISCIKNCIGKTKKRPGMAHFLKKKNIKLSKQFQMVLNYRFFLVTDCVQNCAKFHYAAFVLLSFDFVI